MKQVIRLTESDLKNIVEKSVRRAIKEGAVNEYGLKDLRNDALLGGGIAAAGLGAMAGNAYLHDDEPENPEQQEINQAVADEFGSAQGKMPNDTISWEEANGLPESRIRRAVMESIKKLMRESSYDTISSAADASNSKVADIERKYGTNSYVADKARKQRENFRKKRREMFDTASDTRKGTMQKNDADRREGERTYKKGIGWRTENHNG